MIVGVDPGVHGGIAVLDDDRVRLLNMPIERRKGGKPRVDEEAVMALFREFAARTVISIFIEDIPKFVGGPRQVRGAHVAVLYGNFKFIHGFCLGLGLVVKLLRPQAWQEAVEIEGHATEDRTAWKNKLKDRAIELYPDSKITLSTCDALLIAHAGRNFLSS